MGASGPGPRGDNNSSSLHSGRPGASGSPGIDLVLVIDSAPSMALWRSTVAELAALIRASSVFSAVQEWRFDTTETAHPEQGTVDRLVLRSGEAGGAPLRPADLLDRSNRQVVLVVTDGLGDLWREDLISPVLVDWALVAPIAILHLLPARMWDRHGLELHQVELTAERPLVPNRRYRLKLVDEWVDPARYAGLAESAVPVPVLEYSPRWLRWWSALVARGGCDVAAKAFLAQDQRSAVVDASWTDQVNLPVSERVTHFRSVASPPAYRLATLLAAVPVSVEVAKTLQKKMVPGSGAAHLAEVFTSGLLEASPSGVAWDVAKWEIPIAVREHLLSGARRSETADAIEVAYQHRGREDQELAHLRRLIAEPGEMPDWEAAAVAAGGSLWGRVVLGALSGPYLTTIGSFMTTIGPVSEATALAAEETFASSEPSDVGMEADLARERAQARAAAGGISRHEPRPEGEAVPVWGQIPPRNANFTGRGELLAQLAWNLGAGATAVLPAALHGLGGIGKTQMAVEYVYRNQRYYDIIWWIQATRPTQIRKSLTELAQRLSLIGSGEAITAVPAILEALRIGAPHNRWLLVFDSAEDPNMVREFFPSGLPDNVKGHILVTSRNPGWDGVARPLEVAVFDRAESKRLLSIRGSKLDDEAADRISSKLGDLPLAVEQVAAWLAETGMPAAEYLQLFDSKVAELLDTPAPRDYEVSVAAAWNVSLDELRERNPAADQFLQVCAYFAPEPIARRLFSGARGVKVAPELDAALQDPIRLAHVIRDLNRYGLAKIDPHADTLLLHRLVQLVLRSRMSAQRSAEMRRGAHRLLAHLDPDAPTSPRYWPRYQEIVPHVYDAELTGSTDPTVRRLVVNLCKFLYHWGDHQGARVLAENAVEAWKRDRGERREQGQEVPDEALLLEFEASERLSFFQWVVGRYEEANKTIKETLAACKEAFGAQHKVTLGAEVASALILKARGEFTEARKLNEDVLTKAKGLLGPDDPITLGAAHDCVVSLLLTGAYKEARDLAEQTYHRRVVFFGHDNDMTISTQVLLVIARRELGDYHWARVEQEQITKRAELFYGNDRVGTLRRKYHLSVACRKDGDHVRAHALSSDASDRFRARYGDKHPNALACALGLSIDLRHAQLLDEAKELGEKVFGHYRQSLGEKHPHTLSAAVGLGVTLRLGGSPEEAQKLDERSLETLSTDLGADHPHTIVCGINVASDLFALERVVEAKELDVELVERATRILGSLHPTTLAVRLNHSLDLRELGQTEEADKLFADVMHGYRHKLGESHPGTRAASRRVRADCDIDPIPL